MKTKMIFLALAILMLTLAACGGHPAELIEEPAATEPAPDPNLLPDGARENRCGDQYWFNQTNTPEFAGFDHKEVLLKQVADGYTAHQTWLIELAQISINDRVVYFPNLLVNQRLNVEGEEKLVQDLEPEKWINKALELSHRAPPVTIDLSFEWKYDGSYGYNWYVLNESVSCK